MLNYDDHPAYISPWFQDPIQKDTILLNYCIDDIEAKCRKLRESRAQVIIHHCHHYHQEHDDSYHRHYHDHHDNDHHLSSPLHDHQHHQVSEGGLGALEDYQVVHCSEIWIVKYYSTIYQATDFISIFQKVKLALNLLVFLHQQFSMASNKFFILQPSQNVLKNCQTNYCHHHP